jgi:hypothetical protein
MTLKIILDRVAIDSLDLSPAITVLEALPQDREIAAVEQQLQFAIDYPLDATDPRELSEIPEIRLWFIRLNAVYPWLPFLLDAKAGELARYAAMLVPHQFNRSEGIIYNPEALEIFVMDKIFIVSDWCKKKGILAKFRLKSMAKVLGYDVDDSFFDGL